MKKTLIFIILQIFCSHQEVVATIHKTIFLKKEHSVLSFQAQRFLFLAVKTDTSKQKCVQIHLKDSTILYGKVSSMDETHLFIQSCDSKNALITSIPITTVSQVTDTQGKIIFNNCPNSQIPLTKKEKRGVFLANFSLKSVIASLAALLIWQIVPKSLLILRDGFVLTPLGNVFVWVYLGGLALGFIIGVISLMMLKRFKNKKAERNALIGIAPVLFFFLIYFFASIFSN